MARSIHITTARTMLNSGDPVDISVWKSDALSLNSVTSFHSVTRSTEAGATSSCLPPASAVRFATAASSASTTAKYSFDSSHKMSNFAA